MTTERAGPGGTAGSAGSARSAGALVDALARWVPTLLPDTARAEAIVAACAGAVIDRSAPVDAELCHRIERAAHRHSRHLLLFFDGAGELSRTTEDAGWPPPDLRAIRRRAGSVRSVERTPDGIATIRIDALDPFDVAEPYLDAAAILASRATALVLDLRFNGGGDPATVSYLAGLVLGDATALSEVHGADGITPWNAVPPVGECRLADGTPVAVLVGPATFSSAEALAYHLQVRGRAHIVGEQTPGAADHVTPVVLTSHVSAQLPIARVVDVATRSNWEGTGVVPDLVCDVEGAHEAALDWIRARLSARLSVT